LRLILALALFYYSKVKYCLTALQIQNSSRLNEYVNILLVG